MMVLNRKEKKTFSKLFCWVIAGENLKVFKQPKTILSLFTIVLFLNCFLLFSVGKTCLLRRFVRQDFSNDYKATIGADFLRYSCGFLEFSMTMVSCVFSVKILMSMVVKWHFKYCFEVFFLQIFLFRLTEYFYVRFGIQLVKSDFIVWEWCFTEEQMR